jgi:hypothetical protein
MGFNGDNVDALFNKSVGLSIHKTILEMIMTTDSGAKEKMVSEEEGSFIEKKFTNSLFKLCPTVLSNVLTVMGDKPASSPKNAQAGEEGSSTTRAAPLNNNQLEGDDSSDTDNDLKPSLGESSNHQRVLANPSVLSLIAFKRFIKNTNSTLGSMSSPPSFASSARKKRTPTTRTTWHGASACSSCGVATSERPAHEGPGRRVHH